MILLAEAGGGGWEFYHSCGFRGRIGNLTIVTVSASRAARPSGREGTAAQPDTRPTGRAKAHVATGRNGPDTAVGRQLLNRRPDLPSRARSLCKTGH